MTSVHESHRRQVCSQQGSKLVYHPLPYFINSKQFSPGDRSDTKLTDHFLREKILEMHSILDCPDSGLLFVSKRQGVQRRRVQFSGHFLALLLLYLT